MGASGRENREEKNHQCKNARKIYENRGHEFSHWKGQGGANITDGKGRLGNVVSGCTTMCSAKIRKFYKRRGEMGIREQLAFSATKGSWRSGL